MAIVKADAAQGPATGWYIDTKSYLAKRQVRHQWLRLYRAYYAGDPYSDPRRWRSLLGYPEEVQPPRVQVNFARLVVERPMGWVLGGLREVKVRAERPEEGEFAEKFFRQAVAPLLEELHVELAVSGDALLVLRLPEEAGGLPRLELIPALHFDVEPGEGGPRMVRITYQSRRGGKLYEHREELMAGSGVRYRPRRVEPETVGLIFRRSGRPQVAERVPYPAGFVPFIHLRNRPRPDRIYGTSDLRDLIRLIDDFNLKLSERSRYLSRTLTPLIKNVNGQVVGGGPSPDGVISVVGEQVELDYLRPGVDPASAGEHLRMLRQLISELSGAALMEPSELSSIGALSGFALSLLMHPIERLTARKRGLIFEQGAMGAVLMAVEFGRLSGALPGPPGAPLPQIEFSFEPMPGGERS